MTQELASIFEVYPASAHSAVPLGIRVNDMVMASRLDGLDDTGTPTGGLKEQVATVFAKMRRLVEQAGGTLDNVARAVAYVTQVEDREPVNGEWWEELFPDRNDRPAYKVILADLPPGQLVQLDALALIGARRRRIDITNISARDPTVVVGNLVISSRCHGNDALNGGQLVDGGVTAEALQTFRNLRQLVSIAGGRPSDIVQLNAYGRDESYAPAARAAFAEAFADVDEKPEFHTLVNFIGARNQIAIDMVAVLVAP